MIASTSTSDSVRPRDGRQSPIDARVGTARASLQDGATPGARWFRIAMIPRIAETSVVHSATLEFIEAARAAGFQGELESNYADRIAASTDNSIYQILPQAVAYPVDSADVVILASLADEPRFHGVCLSPRGGGTGTNGQSLNDGVVVDVSRHMNRILEIDANRRVARVQAGVVKDQLEAALRPHGLFFAPELSTSNRATIGGMVSTDASGQGSCLYGKTRDHVLSLKSVFLGGVVFESRSAKGAELSGLCDREDRVGALTRTAMTEIDTNAALIRERFPKLNRSLTGYDLAHARTVDGHFDLNALLCGSEGTLAFVVEATVNLTPEPRLVAQGRQGLVFRRADVDEACVERVQAAVRQRVLGLFERRGLLSRETVGAMQGWGHRGGFFCTCG